MELLDLPSELILAFGDCADPPSLSALASTSRWLHSLLNPLLYRRNAKEQHSAAIIWAAENGRIDTARLCLAHGADINTSLALREENQQTDNYFKYSESGTPLHYAVRRGHDDLVRSLLATGADHQCWCTNLCGCEAPPADPTTFDHETTLQTSHWSPLHLAICNGRNSTATILIEWGVSCESTLQLSWISGREAPQLQPSPLNVMHEIAIHGSWVILNSLNFSNNRVETMINSVSFDGNTPMHYLATRWRSGSAELFPRLLSLNPDLDITNNNLLRPIDCFVDEGNVDAARRLFELGSRPYQLNRCILSACQKGPPMHGYSLGQKFKCTVAHSALVLSLINYALEVGHLSRNIGENRRVSLLWFEIFQLACFQPPLLYALLSAELKPDSLTGEHSVLLKVLEIVTGLRIPDDFSRALIEAIRLLARAGERWDRRGLHGGEPWDSSGPQHRTPLDQLVKYSDSVAPDLQRALFNSLLGSRPPEKTGAEQAHMNQLSQYALENGKMEIYRHLVRHGAKNPSVYQAPTDWESSTATEHQGPVALQWFKPDLKLVTANRLGMSTGRPT